MNPADHDLDSPVGDVVQELPVMGDQHKRASIILQITLEPFDGLYIKVVCRLVKQQYVRLGKKYLRKLDTHIPALTESLRRS